MSKPKLTLKKVRRGEFAYITATVTVTVHASELDLALFAAGSPEPLYRVRCKLFGADAWPDQDNFLFRLDDQFLPEQEIRSTYNLTFSEERQDVFFNEDNPGRDEIFARVSLRNLLSGSNHAVRDSSEVHIHAF